MIYMFIFILFVSWWFVHVFWLLDKIFAMTILFSAVELYIIWKVACILDSMKTGWFNGDSSQLRLSSIDLGMLCCCVVVDRLALICWQLIWLLVTVCGSWSSRWLWFVLAYWWSPVVVFFHVSLTPAVLKYIELCDVFEKPQDSRFLWFLC